MLNLHLSTVTSAFLALLLGILSNHAFAVTDDENSDAKNNRILLREPEDLHINEDYPGASNNLRGKSEIESASEPAAPRADCADSHSNTRALKRKAEADEITDAPPLQKARHTKEQAPETAQERKRYSPNDLYKLVHTHPHQIAHDLNLQKDLAEAYLNGFINLNPKHIDLLFPDLNRHYSQNPSLTYLAIQFKKELLTKDFLDELREKAKSDDPLTLNLLGCISRQDREDEEAFQLFTRAAGQGFTQAQTNLGVMYRLGRGVPQSDQEAAKWLIRAADQGFAKAQRYLGIMYQQGRGVPQSEEEAFKWFHLAAEQGDTFAQCNLGFMYQLGQGVPQSDQQAFKWYYLAAEQGDAAAQYNLGALYQLGEGVPQSDQQTFKWYYLAAGQGYAKAQAMLWFMYRLGRGVPQSDQEAAKWLIRAAAQGFALAQHTLGSMYRLGQGAPQSDEEAFKWYHLAAEQGFADARTGLSRLIEVAPPTCSITLSEFTLSQGQSERIDGYLAQLESLRGRFNPEGAFEDSHPLPYLYRSFGTLIKDLVECKSIIPFFNRAGFLVTNITPKFNVCQSQAEKPYLRALNIGERDYYCIGEENVETGFKLQKLLWRMDEPDYFTAMYLLKDISDIEDPETVEALKQIDEMKLGLEELTSTLKGAIKDGTEQRNQLFYKAINLA